MVVSSINLFAWFFCFMILAEFQAYFKALLWQ